MPEEKKSGNMIRISGCIWGVTFLLTAAFWIGAALLPEGMDYRVWFWLTGLAWSLLVMPVAFMVFLQGILWKKKQNGKQVLKTVLAAVSLGIFVIYFWGALVFLWVMSLDLGKESVFAEGIIQTQTEYLSSVPSFTSYQEPVGLFLKKEYEPITDVVLLYMEQKYGTSFTLAAEGEAGGIANCYQVSPVDCPDVVVKVREMFGGTFSDDYSTMWAYYLMEKKAAEVCPERTLKISYGGQEATRLADAIVMTCNGTEDMEACAGDAAALIAGALEDNLFYMAGNGVKLVVWCETGTGEGSAADLYFGNAKHGRTSYDLDIDYYTDAALVYKKLLYAYDELAAQATGAEEQDDQSGAAKEEGVKAAEEQEASPYFVEGAYRVLYEELFADAGYPYDYGYNAKGNFYANLCEGEGELESTPGTFAYKETVVYDRESKNGKCHLFVHYRTYYQDGTEYTTEILDMYAVDMATGKVYLSGRQGWADVGSQAYRDATGEP